MSTRSPSAGRLLHVISGLGAGGAEGMLGRLAPHLRALGWDQSVVSLQGTGPAAARLEAAGIPVSATTAVMSAFNLGALTDVVRAIRRSGADIIQGWMYHGNLASLAAGAGAPVVWGIRQCVYDLPAEKPMLRAVIRAGAIGSRWVDHTLYNSEVSRAQHQALGYGIKRSSVIPNGFETEALAPNGNVRDASRQYLGVATDQVVIGLTGRYHPVKGHDIFLRALAAMIPTRPNVMAVLVGAGTEASNRALQRSLACLGLTERVRLLGQRSDVATILQAFDIACCPSLSEAFPNVVGEAMAAGIPVVASDVGDVRHLLGGGGMLVPPGDAMALARVLGDLADRSPRERRESGLEGRRRIVADFSLDRVAELYSNVYANVLASPFIHSHPDHPHE